MTEQKQGWGFPWNSRKAHYFVNGQSLCLSWLYTGALTDNQATRAERGVDDCAACHKKLLKLRPPQAPVQPNKDEQLQGETPPKASP